ncbi:MAG: hypothetical protein CVV14_06910 [Gammaproteobacteria bacterium HGW-Gammaproteobacteria-4]|nr:MAG: hypothetical protein CVV14_06910 [Gammaproteobacteria bacterium HGW-Gammaproteobacteria-4]
MVVEKPGRQARAVVAKRSATPRPGAQCVASTVYLKLNPWSAIPRWRDRHRGPLPVKAASTPIGRSGRPGNRHNAATPPKL